MEVVLSPGDIMLDGDPGPPFREGPQFWRHESFSSLNRKISKLAYYRNYCIDSNQIMHSQKDHQMHFVDGSNTRITNPRRQMAAILERLKNRHISAMVSPTARKFGTVMHIDCLDPSVFCNVETT